MSASNDLTFRRLDDEEMGMADGLVSMVNREDPKSESWGVTPAGGRPAGEAFGMFMRDALAGVVWLGAERTGCVEILALAMPRGRWGMGLIPWLAGRVADLARDRGAKELLVRIDAGGAALGEELEDSLFSGPKAEDEGYPCGEWRRPVHLPE